MQTKDLIARAYVEHADEEILNQTLRKTRETERKQSVVENDFLIRLFIKEGLLMSVRLHGWTVSKRS
jgi:hypothetical protein